jgi:hypothetical protein
LLRLLGRQYEKLSGKLRNIVARVLLRAGAAAGNGGACKSAFFDGGERRAEWGSNLG